MDKNEIESLTMQVAKNIIHNCARVSSNEEVLLIADGHDEDIVRLFWDAIINENGQPVICYMKAELHALNAPPQSITRAMRGASLIIMVSGTPVVHTAATQESLHNGARILILNRLKASMLKRKSFQADFAGISPICTSIADDFTRSNRIKITTEAGTDLNIEIEGRTGNALTGIPAPGQIHCLPNIEANVSPLEDGVDGVLVVDGGVPHLRLSPVSSDIMVQFEKGVIREISGGQEAKILKERIDATGEVAAATVGEFGIGLNPYCEFVGIPIEDEGKYGTAHIAIGNNALFGGLNRASIHYDMIFKRPTITVDDRIILRNGSLVDYTIPIK